MSYRYEEQTTPPAAERASDVAITTFEHVYEVDPRLMQRWVLQQEFPNWDSLRIMNARHQHLEWMHRHFATTVVTGSELLAEIESESPATSESRPPATTEAQPPATMESEPPPQIESEPR